MILTYLNAQSSEIPFAKYEIDLVEGEDELLKSMNSFLGNRKKC
jgi:hypothetical protein